MRKRGLISHRAVDRDAIHQARTESCFNMLPDRLPCRVITMEGRLVAEALLQPASSDAFHVFHVRGNPQFIP